MWSQADLAILVPMLGRPHRVEPLLASIEAATPEAKVLFLVSPEDRQVHRAIERQGRKRLTVPRFANGDYARKINYGYRHTTEPLLFLGADDLHFHPGWFEKAVELLTGRVQVVGTNDLTNRRTITGRHSTHSLLTRSYADLGTCDGPGILHEGYPHEYVDDEFIQTASRRKVYAHCPEAIVEHLHPMSGKAPMDRLYAAQAERMERGKVIFLERRRLWKTLRS